MGLFDIAETAGKEAGKVAAITAIDIFSKGLVEHSKIESTRETKELILIALNFVADIQQSIASGNKFQILHKDGNVVDVTEMIERHFK